MTFPGMSPADEHSVDPACECLQNEHRINPSGAHDPDHPDIRRILGPGNPGQIGSGV